MIQVTAHDADDPTYGNSAKLVYTVVEGLPFFSVDPQTGAGEQGGAGNGAGAMGWRPHRAPLREAPLPQGLLMSSGSPNPHLLTASRCPSVQPTSVKSIKQCPLHPPIHPPPVRHCPPNQCSLHPIDPSILLSPAVACRVGGRGCGHEWVMLWHVMPMSDVSL